MIPEILTIALVAVGVLFFVMRIFGYLPKGDERSKIKATPSGKLYYSKTYDLAFFDGASEDYNEALNRMRQQGGA
ncbi:MAG: hypothetical protein ACFFAZ_16395 [Promethearchaeota archaeon]